MRWIWMSVFLCEFSSISLVYLVDSLRSLLDQTSGQNAAEQVRIAFLSTMWRHEANCDVICFCDVDTPGFDSSYFRESSSITH